MRNLYKRLGFIALIAVIGFSISACPDPDGPNGPGNDLFSPGPTVTSVVVSAAEDATFVNKGNTLQFSAVVNGTNGPSQAVTWTITASGKKGSTLITSEGLLTVDSAEATRTITVQAVSKLDPSKKGTAIVTVNDPKSQNLSGEISIQTNGADITKAVAGTTLTAAYTGDEKVTYQWYNNGGIFDTNLGEAQTKANIAGEYTVLVSASGYNSKISAPVTVTGDIAPEILTANERWYKWMDDTTSATVGYAVDANGKNTVTVSGTAESAEDRWKATVNYEYTAAAGKRYEYSFKAWTNSGNRTLDIKYYNDWDGNGTILARPGFEITATEETYTIIGEKIPKSRRGSLEFNCADQTGTFYIQIISIKETNVQPRWTYWRDASSTAHVDSFSEASDGTATIKISGTAEKQGQDDVWNAWKITATYNSYASKANTRYKYTIQAWKEPGAGNGIINVQYYSNVPYKGQNIELTTTPTIYEIYGEKLPAKQDNIDFQCANQIGTIHLKVISIEEYDVGELTITNFRGAPGPLRSDKWSTGEADIGDGKRIQFIQHDGGFEVPPSGSSLTVNVYNTEEVENEYGYVDTKPTTPFTGNVTVEAGALSINQWDENDDYHAGYRNKAPITFTNGKATINFGTQMELTSTSQRVGTLTITNITGIDFSTIYGGYGSAYINEWVQLSFDFYSVVILSTSSIRLNVIHTRYGNEPVFSNGTAPQGSLWIYVYGWDYDKSFTNKSDITFTNGSATVNFSNFEEDNYSGGGDPWNGGDPGGDNSGGGGSGYTLNNPMLNY